MKIKCKKCNDIIEGDKKGTFIQCKCKSCYIDETKYYVRVGGNPSEIEQCVEEGGKENWTTIFDFIGDEKNENTNKQTIQ